MKEIAKFVEAHDRYLALDHARMACTHPHEREQLHIDILEAYLEVQHWARVITGMEQAGGLSFAKVN